MEGEEAKNKVAEYNEQGKKAVSSHQSSYNRGSRDYNNRQRRDGTFDDFKSYFQLKIVVRLVEQFIINLLLIDFRDNRDRDRRWGGGDRRYDGGRSGGDWRSQNWRGGGGGGGFDRRDRWHGGGGGGWANNYRGNNRYDDRGYRGGGGGGGSRHRDFGHDRDRRDDRGRNDRNDHSRDFRDGNRDRRGDDKRRHDRGVPQREKDEKHLKQQPSQVSGNCNS